MGWQVELSAGAVKALRGLDAQAVGRILRFLDESVAGASDPRATGKPLKGSVLGDLWRYRVVVDIRDRTLTVLVVRVGHRGDIYR